MATIAITGITGLAGGHVAQALRMAGHTVIGISRSAALDRAGKRVRTVPDLADADALVEALDGCGIVFHFADRADRKSYQEQDVGSAAAVITAIRAATARAGIDRIVAASSVYAERTERNDRYARSKRAMEAVGMAPAPGTPALILRLPPLYGPGARGAVRHIARTVEKGWPLPFALARAPRRFLSLDALADLCIHLSTANDGVFRRAAGQIFVPVEARHGSLAALSRALGQSRTRLLPVPGIDRLLEGKVAAGQLEADRDALFKAVGWQARH
ncbi:UDP-glucose 4-epimerase [Sphingomonas jejuensis]|uniref:UDP-glucose 4-epimerase n=1 Tax=Sphingomonas jejuensis TaxID=904715 RepID=A0ABX0XN82_9SPHN|nr:NAD-dependent epimerase/dehydratase family protein [Sphingomonas jejuensis]NJC34186.1 UDP-glucose 4-epimerase [Sphingomonas jejuensis]